MRLAAWSVDQHPLALDRDHRLHPLEEALRVKTVWNRYAGSGLPYNNNYGGIAIEPDRTAYLGVTGGIISLRDGP